LLFALNDQNIRGVRLVAERISEKAVEIEGRDRPPALIIRPSRVERTGNQAEKIKWQEIAARVLGKYVNDDNPKVLMAKRNIPYIGDYSYGETPLAVDKDPLGDMAGSFEDLAESILRTAGGKNHVRRHEPFFRRYVESPLSYFGPHLRWLQRNKRNVLILILALAVVGFMVNAFLQFEQVRTLSQALAAKTEENNKNAEELQKLRQSQMLALPENTPDETDPQTLPADWDTTKPDEAWCYQFYQSRPGVQPYKVNCYWSQSTCEKAKRRQTQVIAASNCELVQGLNSSGWNPAHHQRDSWYQYDYKAFRPPFPQLAVQPSAR
jgi:hypothetical protein